MGILPDQNQGVDDSDHSASRIKREGSREPLARAKNTLKERLYQKMMEEVLQEMQDVEQVADEVMVELSARKEALQEAKDATKARLVDHVYQEAIEEFRSGFTVAPEEVVSRSQGETVAEAKETVKGHLVDRVYQEAIEEFESEFTVAPDEVTERSQSESIEQAKETVRGHLLDRVYREATEEFEASFDVSPEEIASRIEGDNVANAVETVKTSLVEHVYQQATSELQQGFEVTPDAIASLVEGDSFAETKEAIKTQLIDHLYQQAIDELGAGFEVASDEVTTRAQGAVIEGIKEAVKERLLDHVYQQAIEEIGEEMDIDPDVLISMQSTDLLAAEESAEVRDEPSEVEEVDTPDVSFEFWEEDDHHGEEILDPEVEISLSGEDTPHEDDDAFFLPENPRDLTEPGKNSESDSKDSLAGDPQLHHGDGSWFDLGTDSLNYEDAADVAEELLAAFNEEDSQPIESATYPEADEEIAVEGEAYYVYGILNGGADVEEGLLPKEGMDPAYPVYVVSWDNIHALVSKVPLSEYGKEVLANNLIDPVWADERVGIHEVLVKQISALGGTFLPVPFCSVYEDEVEVRKMLSEVGYMDALERIQGKHQWSLKLFRNVDTLHQRVVEHSPAVQELMDEIKRKKRGSRSLKKQMVTTIQEEIAQVTDDSTKDIHERLFVYAEDVILGDLEETTNENRGLILQATYLVDKTKESQFSAEVGRMTTEYEALGFEFVMEGPSTPSMFTPFQTAGRT